MADTDSAAAVLDVRALPKPAKHPTIFAEYDGLEVGGCLVLVNDHDPRHLHEEFVTEHAGGFTWEYLSREPRNWRIRITKRAATPTPRVLVNTNRLDESAVPVAGAAWRLEQRTRDLDCNLIVLPPGGHIDMHDGPQVDVLIHVTAGGGELRTEFETHPLEPGAVAWLPRRSRRGFAAGPLGLTYLTAHQRRQALILEPVRTAGMP